MCWERLTNLQHSKNCFARERTEKVTVITMKQHFDIIKRRTLAAQYRFYFFVITKNVLIVSKSIIVYVFQT